MTDATAQPIQVRPLQGAQAHVDRGSRPAGGCGWRGPCGAARAGVGRAQGAVGWARMALAAARGRPGQPTTWTLADTRPPDCAPHHGGPQAALRSARWTARCTRRSAESTACRSAAAPRSACPGRPTGTTACRPAHLRSKDGAALRIATLRNVMSSAVHRVVHVCRLCRAQGYPTIKFFGTNKRSPDDYNGGRDSGSIIAFATAKHSENVRGTYKRGPAEEWGVHKAAPASGSTRGAAGRTPSHGVPAAPGCQRAAQRLIQALRRRSKMCAALLVCAAGAAARAPGAHEPGRVRSGAWRAAARRSRQEGSGAVAGTRRRGRQGRPGAQRRRLFSASAAEQNGGGVLMCAARLSPRRSASATTPPSPSACASWPSCLTCSTLRPLVRWAWGIRESGASCFR
jgi:hypothetical protein